jgi:putative transposase
MKSGFIRKDNRHVVKSLYTSNHLYFITICINNRVCVFDITNKSNILISNGDTEAASTTNIIILSLFEVINFYHDVELIDWVIMPNHLHFIVTFGDNPRCKVMNKNITLPKLIQSFKVRSQKLIVEAASVSPFVMRQFPTGFNYNKLWQKSYYDHIIRNEKDLIRIREYIRNNPLQWELDILNPVNENLFKSQFANSIKILNGDTEAASTKTL